MFVLLIYFRERPDRTCLKIKQIAVTVADPSTGKGYQLKGTAELLDSGPLFESVCKQVAGLEKGLPAPHYAIKVTVEAVFDQSAGTETRQADRLIHHLLNASS